MPILLFLATCVSTFMLGSLHWHPNSLTVGSATDGVYVRQLIYEHWQDGLIYMVCLLGILLFHEFGHFIATLRYRIPASFPFFLPCPVNPLGTLGAVIVMDGKLANRKEIFDIGLAGPIAGLVVAVPVMWIGVHQLDLSTDQFGTYRLDLMAAASMFIQTIQPPGHEGATSIWQQQLNPYFMAGWVGMLVTGLNMMPVSQLDGGHVLYAIFGRRAHWIARGFMAFAIAHILFHDSLHWLLMYALVYLLIGIDHPPTSDDTVKLGWFRIALGLASLAIPFLTFTTYFIR
ncbi:MAG: site-2 protease family protein [Pirellulaceae bacterium]|nr:site-2 protease family protein [Pirellulaceae bacterium]MDP7015006.1 site-2 protease family protein [Pirellulaceae bacterium]